MSRKLRLLGPLLLLMAAAPGAVAQEVQVAALPEPDLFSAAARETGLGPDLWKGASPEALRDVIRLAQEARPSPAARALALRLLGSGAAAPGAAGRDAALAAGRLRALLALGDLAGAETAASRTPGLERSSALSAAAAELALLSDDTPRACQIAERLSEGRGEAYWLRLRAFCRLEAQDPGQAQLTFDLAQSQAPDPVFGRLMGARLRGAGGGPASLRNGLDLALSRRLGLDLAVAKPAPQVAVALAGAPASMAPVWRFTPETDPVSAALAQLAAGDLEAASQARSALVQDQIPGADALDLAILDAALGVARGRPDGPTLDRLVERAGVGETGERNRARAAAALVAAAGAPVSGEVYSAVLAAPGLEAKAPDARLYAMDLAADANAQGQAAALALLTALEAGETGPALGDRVQIVRTLRRVGLQADAAAFALEGLVGLR